MPEILSLNQKLVLAAYESIACGLWGFLKKRKGGRFTQLLPILTTGVAVRGEVLIMDYMMEEILTPSK